MAEGVTHISLPTQEYDRGRQEKTNRRTNTNKAWGYQEQKRGIATLHGICGLSLAWVTSENSTMLLESDILRLFFTGPYLVSSLSARCPVLTAPPFFHANFCCSPPLVQSQLPSLCSPATNSSVVSCPTTNSLSGPCLSLGRIVNSHSPPRTTSGVRRDFMSKNPLSGFAPKQTRLLWRPTPIVLHIFVVQLVFDLKLQSIC